MTEADIIIIGAGPGGMELCGLALKQNRRVVVIERDHIGGTCLNRGCIPTKALCKSAEVVNTVKEASQFGIDVTGFSLSYATAFQRKNEVVKSLRDGAEMSMRGADIVYGEAEFKDDKTVAVGDELYTAPLIVIATGSEPALLPIPGADLCVTSDDLLSMDSLPEDICIIGGGVIGMESACILASFDVKVTVIEYCPEILPNFDKEIGKRLKSFVGRKGIKVITSAAVKAVRPGLEVEYESKGKLQSLNSSCVLMAVGRKAVIPKGCEAIGIATGRKGIIVDSAFSTTVPGIYAIGDVNGHLMLAHVASAQAAVLMGEKTNLDVVPSAAFTQPECAMVGLTEDQCKDKEINIRVAKSLFRANGKAMSMGEADGFVKTIIESESGKVLGCHIIGPHAADLIQEVALCMSSGLTANDIASTIHAHPTLNEVVASSVKN